LKLAMLKEGKKFVRCLLKRPSALPEDVQIEVTNRCPLNCRMCPRRELKVPFKDMPLDTYREIMKRIPSADTVILTGWGEPLIHADFFEMVKIAKRRFPDSMVRFATGGNMLDKNAIRRIIETGVGQVSISIDVSPQSADDGNIGHPPLTDILDNVKELIRLRGSAARPIVCFQIVLQSEGGGAVEPLIRAGAETGIDYINLLRLDTRITKGIARPTWAEERRAIVTLRQLARKEGVGFFCINDQNIFMRIASHHDAFCLRTDNYVYIDVEGNVTPCCNVRHYVGGNILKQELAEIWHGKRFENFRRRQLAICGGCDVLKNKYSDDKNRGT